MIAAHNVSAGFSPPAGGWMLDSGGFTKVTKHGGYDRTPAGYVRFVMDLQDRLGGLVCAFQQDYPATGATAEAMDGAGYFTRGHRLEGTLEGCAMKTRSRWVYTLDAARSYGCRVPLAPVLQGATISDYVECLRLLRPYLQPVDAGPRPRVGIGALKGRSPAFVRELALALQAEAGRHGRPYRFHALGIGKKYIRHPEAGPTLCRLLTSYDSAAWKVRARYAGADQNGTGFANQYAQDLEPTAPLFDHA